MDHNFANTPARVARMYLELFSPPELDIPVFNEDFTDMVIMRGHEFYTMCPHHLLPVRLHVSVAYLPNGSVIGASKLMRMVHDVNRYPMTQEKLTAMILARIYELVGDSRGAAVFMTGTHGCFRMRGVRSGAEMITLKFSGAFDTEPDLRNRFLDLVRGGV